MFHNILIEESENTKIIDSIINNLKNTNNKFAIKKISNQEDIEGYTFVILTNFDKKDYIKTTENSTIINIHPSILPAFSENNALTTAYTSGVKVSGISIHLVERNNFYGKILTQYPILIGLDTEFIDYQNEIIEIGSNIYPKVINSLLEDKIFDFKDLLTAKKCNSNNSHCKNCNGCH